ncbi:MAG TPA: phasin family protein [Burkholderiaceae bacterium]|nr:phasin family protein [Burkholderiaceae bacterium]
MSTPKRPDKRPAVRKPGTKSPVQAREPAADDGAQTKGAPNVALRAAKQIIEAQKMLLHAGLRVLRVEREGQSPEETAPASMEEVFDRRVASALQRLGMPDASELARLAKRVESLERHLATMRPKARRPTSK